MSLPVRALRRIRRRELVLGAAAAGVAACVGCSPTEENTAAETTSSAAATPPPAAEITEAPDTQQPIGLRSVVELGTIEQVNESIREANGFWYVPQGRFWVTAYPVDALERARTVYSDAELVGMEAGFVALYQKCPHLGCRIPSCETSQWFECPCHGSKYNQVGEKQRGPAPRGMDRFAVIITDDDQVLVDTASVITGPPIGTDTTTQSPAGPFCIADALD